MLVIHSLNDCGTVKTFLSGLSCVSYFRSLENFTLKVGGVGGGGSGIFRMGGCPMGGLHPSTNYEKLLVPPLHMIVPTLAHTHTKEFRCTIDCIHVV